MIKPYIITFWLLLPMLPALGQRTPEVLATIGHHRVYTEDFKLAYERNNGNITDPAERKSPAEYLQLYINFKLKVIEAQALGLDTLQSFRQELAGYRSDLAAPYLTDLSYEEQLLEETYERLASDINASHLLIALPPNPSPADTLKAWREINRIAGEIASGLSFSQAARQYSQDPSASANSGELGWFTAFQMVTPFENAAYNTPVGAVSEPVRTRFGYHLLKVNETRKAAGEIKVAHIMKRFPPDMNPEQKRYIRKQIDSLYQLAIAGEDFSRLAREHSEDDRSAVNGGELPYFGRSMMIPAFSDPAFSLTSDGEISLPLETDFGFHILKRLDLKPIPPLDEIRSELINRIKRDPERFAMGRAGFIEKLKKQNNFQFYSESFEKVVEQLAGFSSIHENVSALFQTPSLSLFSLAGNNFDSHRWLRELIESRPGAVQITREDAYQHFSNWVEAEVIAWEDAQLETKYPAFRSLYQEYHDGILLFDVMEKMLWQPAATDTAGLLKFYETNKNRYWWDERFEGLVLSSGNSELLNKALAALDQGITAENLVEALGSDESEITFVAGIWQKGDHPAVDYSVWNGPVPAGWNVMSDAVWGNLIPPAPKLLSEARGFHLADYQQYLEDQWLLSLRNKYPVVVNNRALRRL